MLCHVRASPLFTLTCHVKAFVCNQPEGRSSPLDFIQMFLQMQNLYLLIHLRRLVLILHGSQGGNGHDSHYV